MEGKGRRDSSHDLKTTSAADGLGEKLVYFFPLFPRGFLSEREKERQSGPRVSTRTALLHSKKSLAQPKEALTLKDKGQVSALKWQAWGRVKREW